MVLSFSVVQPRTPTDALIIVYSSMHSLHRALNSVRVSKVKYVVWSPDMSHVALLGRNG